MPMLKGMEVSGFVEIDRKVRFKQGLIYDLVNPWGDVFYVNKNHASADDDNGGKAPSVPLSTVPGAIDKAGAWDWIVISPGIYDSGEEIVLAYEGMKLLGANTSGIEWGPCSLKASAADHGIVSVQANGCEIAGLGFIQNNANFGVEIDHTAAVYKTHIHDCHFGGSATATYGVKAGGTFDAVDAVIDHCEFLSWATSCIYLRGTRCKATDNLIFIAVDNGVGITYYNDGGDRPYAVIDNNIIMGTGTGDHGIVFSGSPTKGTCMVCRNIIGGCAETIAQASGHEFDTCNNYAASTAGGTLIDTVA